MYAFTMILQLGILNNNLCLIISLLSI